MQGKRAKITDNLVQPDRFDENPECKRPTIESQPS
jgi:hypothetical protein